MNFIYYLSTEKFAEGSKILPELEKDFNKYKQKISLPHQISIPHYIGLLYFQSEYYDKAYTYFKNIVNSGNKGIKEDMRLFCRLVLAIIAYEQDNDSELDSICRHIIRKEEHKQHYSKQVAATLKRVFGALKDTKQRLFTELKEALEEREVYEHGRTQILIWLEKKI